MKYVHGTILAVEAAIFWECVCSLWYPACNVHVPFCHLWPAWIYSVFYFTLSHKWHDFQAKNYWT